MATELKLTEYGQRVAQAIVDDRYLGIAGADDGWEYFTPWAEDFAWMTARALGVPAASVGGIVAGLSEAGFLSFVGEGREEYLVLTEEGTAYCAALAAKKEES